MIDFAGRVQRDSGARAIGAGGGGPGQDAWAVDTLVFGLLA